MNDRSAASGLKSGPGQGEDTGIVRGLIATLVDAVRTRLDLAAVEIEMYLLRVLQMLLWAVAAVAFAVLALVFGLVSLIVALWETHRLTALLGGTLLFVVLSAACGLIGARVFRNRRGLLEGTLQQLEHDQRQAGGGGL
jgi:uncharacterized membrane protein YqjE